MDSDDDTGIDPEIAAAMGFTGFGAQPAKRRKYNHNSDAIIEGQQEVQTAPSGSGANNTTLGVRVRGGGAETEERQDKITSTEVSADTGKSKNKGKGKQAAPLGLADYVSWGNKVTAPAPVPVVAEKKAEVAAVTPVKKADWTTWVQGPPSAEELQALRRGIKNTRGDMVCYLPSFIEDPWAELRTGTAGG